MKRNALIAGAVIVVLCLCILIFSGDGKDPMAELYHGMTREEVLDVFGKPDFYGTGDKILSNYDEYYKYSFLGEKGTFQVYYDWKGVKIDFADFRWDFSSREESAPFYLKVVEHYTELLGEPEESNDRKTTWKMEKSSLKCNFTGDGSHGIELSFLFYDY